MHIPEKVYSWTIFALCIVTSVGGVVCAVVYNHADDGGRGGAIGTALALGFMFINRDYGFQTYKALIARAPTRQAEINALRKGGALEAATKVETAEQVKKELDTLVSAIIFDEKGQQTQNKFLALATFISTIIWGFGDWFAGFLIKHPLW